MGQYNPFNNAQQMGQYNPFNNAPQQQFTSYNMPFTPRTRYGKKRRNPMKKLMRTRGYNGGMMPGLMQRYQQMLLQQGGGNGNWMDDELDEDDFDDSGDEDDEYIDE